MLDSTITKAGTFDGQIVAKDWDEGGNPLQLVLVTTDKEEIPIYMDLKAESLTEYCKEKVRLRGEVRSGYLHIKSFKFLKR